MKWSQSGSCDVIPVLLSRNAKCKTKELCWYNNNSHTFIICNEVFSLSIDSFYLFWGVGDPHLQCLCGAVMSSSFAFVELSSRRLNQNQNQNPGSSAWSLNCILSVLWMKWKSALESDLDSFWSIVVFEGKMMATWKTSAMTSERGMPARSCRVSESWDWRTAWQCDVLLMLTNKLSLIPFEIFRIFLRNCCLSCLNLIMFAILLNLYLGE